MHVSNMIYIIGIKMFRKQVVEVIQSINMISFDNTINAARYEKHCDTGTK